MSPKIKKTWNNIRKEDACKIISCKTSRDIIIEIHNLFPFFDLNNVINKIKKINIFLHKNYKTLSPKTICKFAMVWDNIEKYPNRKPIKSYILYDYSEDNIPYIFLTIKEISFLFKSGFNTKNIVWKYIMNELKNNQISKDKYDKEQLKKYQYIRYLNFNISNSLDFDNIYKKIYK